MLSCSSLKMRMQTHPPARLFSAARLQGTTTSQLRPVRSLHVVAAANGAETLAEGSKVKVTKSVKVFHVPKKSAGMDLEGMEGTLVKDVQQFKGKVLSANFQYKVEFLIPAEGDGKPVKFFAHMCDDELEVQG